MTHTYRYFWTAIAACCVTLGVSAAARELTGKELCQRLTAEEVSAVLGAGRTAKADDDVCTYAKASVPAVRLVNSRSDSRAEFVELVKTLKGTVVDGPGGSVISAVAFDQKNGTYSAAWFMLDKTPVELEFDRGVELEKARALIDAARR